MKRWLAYPLGGVAALIGAAAGSQALAEARDRRKYPPPGRLVDVDGHRLHLQCLGDGSPTVVLEAGLATCSLDWSRVLPEVARFTRVCAYDRAGHGWSDRGSKPRTSQRLADELHTLLRGAVTSSCWTSQGWSLMRSARWLKRHDVRPAKLMR